MHIKSVAINFVIGKEWINDNEAIYCHQLSIVFNSNGLWQEMKRKWRQFAIHDISNQKHFTRQIPITLCMSNLMLCKFIEITLWDGCSPVNLLHIFRTLLPKNTSRGLFLTYDFSSSSSAKKELLKVSVVKSVLGFCYILSVVFTAFTILLLPFTSSSSKRKSNLLPATTI